MAKRPVDNRLDFESPLQLIPGLGAKRVAALKESGLQTIGDLLHHFPLRYIDRSVILPCDQLAEHVNEAVSVIGTITRTRLERGRRSRLRIQIADDSGATLEVLWFSGIAYLRETLQKGKRVLLTGKISRFGGLQMVHPQLEVLPSGATAAAVAFLPVYPLTAAMRDARLQQRTLFKAIKWALENLKHYPQLLPESIEARKGFAPLAECLRQVHLPSDPAALEPYLSRLRYEELYRLALTLRWSKKEFRHPGRRMSAGELPARLAALLPFELTEDQREAIAVLHTDSADSRRMHRLLQGDVGSGKTLVALFACLPALNHGLQVAWLTPTEVLAYQTHALFSRLLGGLGFSCGLLKGGISSVEKRNLRMALSGGNLDLVVGTHALLQPSITFDKLGMIVIDEQHKFGLEQRLTLQRKDPAADFLLMSATPIPQTLAKTLYGDLDLVTIRSLPANRTPVSTHLVPPAKRIDMLQFIRETVTNGQGQAFYVVPRIEATEEETDSGLQNAIALYDTLRRDLFNGIPMGMVHGRLPAAEKEWVMQAFAQGELKVLVATTVVEVGVDVPEAAIIVIENPESFGLSQLHQLRGRVGRGDRKGFCFLLLGEELEEAAAHRLKDFCRMHDGFAIAELDLQYRGPGQVVGARQSGWEDLKLVDILRDAPLFVEIQREIDQLLGTALNGG